MSDLYSEFHFRRQIAAVKICNKATSVWVHKKMLWLAVSTDWLKTHVAFLHWNGPMNEAGLLAPKLAASLPHERSNQFNAVPISNQIRNRCQSREGKKKGGKSIWNCVSYNTRSRTWSKERKSNERKPNMDRQSDSQQVRLQNSQEARQKF